MVSLRKAAAVSGSQLAHYFADKQTLLRALVERQMQAVDFQVESFEDAERWLDRNMRDLRRIGFTGTPPTTVWPVSSPSPTTRPARPWPTGTGGGSRCWKRHSRR